MPELPEVETVTRALACDLPDRRIAAVSTFAVAMRYPLAPLRSPELVGKRIVDVRRRARYIIIELEQQHALLLHLGMSGSLRIVPRQAERLRHEHVTIDFEDGESLRFRCPRRFGFILPVLLDSVGGEPTQLASLGIEPLTPEFSPDFLYRSARNRARRIKDMLMDNQMVVGIGNIYATEALFRAGIAPFRAASKLSRCECGRLVDAAKNVLGEAIRAGGTTISDYRGIDGSEGKFARQLSVYGRAGQPCPKCSTAILRKKSGGRSAYYCRRCQK